MNIISLSWKNIAFKPLSTFMSVLLFALGVGLVSILLLVENQLRQNFEANLADIDLVIGAKGSPLQLILSSMYHIDAPTGNISIEEARPFLREGHPLIETAIPISTGDSYRGYRIVGTVPAFLDLYGGKLSQGEMYDQHFEVVAGAMVADKLGLELGSTFQSSHGFIEDDQLTHDDAEEFKVVGILAPTGTVADQLLLTTTESFWMVHDHGPEGTSEGEGDEHGHDHEGHDHEGHDHDGHEHEDHGHDHDVHAHEDAPPPLQNLAKGPDDKEITSILVKFKGRNFQALNMQRSINENTDLQAATPAIEINRLYSLMNSGEKALRVLAIAIIFVSALSVFISLYNSLRDRKYEFALMRVMGGRPFSLFAMILIEGLLISTLGALAGLLLSHTVLEVMPSLMGAADQYQMSGLVFLKEELYIMIGACLIGVLAAIFPALQAAKTDISKTLGEE